MHVNVLLTGRLQGMGHQAECEVMARRSPSHGPERFVYSDPEIIHVAGDLPEGEYTLHLENISAPVLHKGVLWTVVGLPPGDAANERESQPKRGRGPIALARRILRDRRKRK